MDDQLERMWLFKACFLVLTQSLAGGNEKYLKKPSKMINIETEMFVTTMQVCWEYVLQAYRITIHWTRCQVKVEGTRDGTSEHRVVHQFKKG